MVLVWFGYGVGMCLVCVLLCVWYVFDMGLVGLALILCMSLLLDESGVCLMVLTGDVEH